ncbi:MAG TPA: hypothetical protein VES67_18325 [Vicinamibacterales bacterium]|nr:hypothetical protein [Vicinamibacterales bacterium]
MRDQELRALVREAVSRHLGDRGDAGREAIVRHAPVPVAPTSSHGHASHAVYIHLVNVDESCVIEPDVACNHCNYCRSHGH